MTFNEQTLTFKIDPMNSEIKVGIYTIVVNLKDSLGATSQYNFGVIVNDVDQEQASS